MDAIERFRRLMNPTCIADYGLTVTREELVETDEGRKILAEEVAPMMEMSITKLKSKDTEY